jgi:hypothetical protein
VKGSPRGPVYAHPLLPLAPQATGWLSTEPVRAMLVAGTAASETVASAAASSFLVFDI